MNWITDQIAVGNIDDALNVSSLSEYCVTAVVSLHWFPLHIPARSVIHRRIELEDGVGNSPELLHQALSALDTLVVAKHRVLVHCLQGVSRSPFVVAGYLALRNKTSLSNAVTLVREHRTRTLVNPHLYLLWDEYLVWRGCHKD